MRLIENKGERQGDIVHFFDKFDEVSTSLGMEEK